MNQETCPNCGMQQFEWGEPEGYEKEEQRYCCQGCADETGCTCRQ